MARVPGPEARNDKEPVTDSSIQIEEIDIDEEFSGAREFGVLAEGALPDEVEIPEVTAPVSTSPARSVLAGIREHAAALAIQVEVEPTTEPVPVPDVIPESNQQADSLPHLVPERVPGLEPVEVLFQGTLRALPVIEILSMIARQELSGVLSIEGEGRRFEMTLQRGRVAQVTCVGLPELRLGRFVREVTNETTEGQIAEVVRARGSYPLGVRLSQAGFLSGDDLQKVLTRQTVELIYESLRLSTGRFVFSSPEELPRLAVDRSMGAALDLDLSAILLEGYRRSHEWHVASHALEEGAVFLRTEERSSQIARMGLSSKEQRILQLCTGRASVAEIARESRLPPALVARTLSRLQSLDLVRRRLPAQAV